MDWRVLDDPTCIAAAEAAYVRHRRAEIEQRVISVETVEMICRWQLHAARAVAAAHMDIAALAAAAHVWREGHEHQGQPPREASEFAVRGFHTLLAAAVAAQPQPVRTLAQALVAPRP